MDWDAITPSGTIDWSFPELTEVDGAVERELGGDIGQVNFAFVADRGQEMHHYMLHPNSLLQRTGLQQADSKAQAFVMKNGAVALTYNATPSSIEVLKRIVEERTRILPLVDNQETVALGRPSIPATEAPDVLLYVKDDYEFTDGRDTEFCREPGTRTHGDMDRN